MTEQFRKFRILAGMLMSVIVLLAFGGFRVLAADLSVSGTITSCVIADDKKTIHITAKSSGSAEGTDGNVYLMEMKMYESSLSKNNVLGSAKIGETKQFQVDLKSGTKEDRLYSGFVMAVKTEAGYQPIGARHYITNPEKIAKNQEAYETALTKKGLNIELNMVGDAMELGVKHVATNIATHQILGSGIDFTYDGKTYSFNKSVIESYDKLVREFSSKDLTVTAILLNGWNPSYPQLYQPGQKQTSEAAYYVFNTSTQEGLETTRAIAAFLAERYDGKHGYGKISNWVIGNEINNQYWNYLGRMNLDRYLRVYQNAFRVFYQAIKSQSASDRVFFSIDYNWNHPNEKDGVLKYGGKEVIDTFNKIAAEEGQMDWGLAYHPYPCPMTEPEFWDDNQTGYLTKDINSPVINFYNLNVLTDYFHTDNLLSPNGGVRNIILTEQGFTSNSATRGSVLQEQAAAYAYSYYLVDSNPDIDAYILSRQVDAPSEVKQGLSFGLYYCDMNKPNEIAAYLPKPIYQVFRDIDKKDRTLAATEFAKDIIGINKWSDVIPNFRWRSME